MKRCLNCMKEYKEEYEVCPHCGYVEGTAPEQSYQLVPGTMLANRYVIGTVIGAGGFGVVYRAWDTQLDIMVAIKEYYPSSLVSRSPGTKEIYIYAKKHEEEYRMGLARFLEEAQNVARFSTHPNIVNVYNFFEENNTAYCVMEYMDGISFKDFIKQEGNIISEDLAIRVVSTVLDALGDVHKAGIIHRDISPDNVMILRSGIVKVMDFGAARFSQREKQTIIFKPGFAPPEQYNSEGKQGAYTDIYAVGATLYRAVTGVMPEEASNRIGEECLVAPRELNPEITENLNNAILRAMAVLPELRFQSTKEFKEALTAYKKVLNAEQEMRRRKKKRIRSMLLAAAILLLGVGLGIGAYNIKKNEAVLTAAELEIWLPAAEDKVSEVEETYQFVIEHFRETYPQITFSLKVINQDDYAEKLETALGTDSMPVLYDSTFVSDTVLQDATELKRLVTKLDKAEFYGLEEYLETEENPVRLPLAFNRPVVYVNTVRTNDLIITTDMLEDTVFSDTDVADFLSGNKDYLLASTECYFDVNAALSGQYEMQTVPDGVLVYADYADYISISKEATAEEKKAAYRFVEYLLSEDMQNVLYSKRQDDLPLNKIAYEFFEEINLEFSVFGEEILTGFKQEK